MEEEGGRAALPARRPREAGQQSRTAGGSAAWHGGALLALAALWLGSVPATHARELESQLKTIADVKLVGVRSVGRGEIRGVLKTKRPSRLPWADKAPLRYDFVRADVQTIRAVYSQHGFLDAAVRDSVRPARDRTRVVVEFHVTEGPRSRIAAVDLESVHVVPHDVLRRRLYARPERPFNPSFLVADTAVIAREYQERGFLPHVVGTARRGDPDSLNVQVAYLVDEGPRYRVGQVYLASMDQPKVAEHLIRRELRLAPGSFYNQTRVEESQERLYETGLFSQVQIVNIPDSTNTLMEFFLQVRERRPRWVDAGIGSGTQERIQLSGEWGHRNLFGRGMQGVLASRYSRDAAEDAPWYGRFLLWRLEASLLEPWLFRFRNRAQGTVYYERSDFHTDSTRFDKDARGFSFTIRRDFGRRAHLRLIQDNTFVDQDIFALEENPLPDSVIAALRRDVVRSYSTHRLQLAGDRDRRDSPVSPLRGSFQTASAEIAGGPFRGSTSFTKYQVSSAWYTPLPWSGWVLATRARAGVVEPFGDRAGFNPAPGVDPDVARVPTEDVFRLGGVNSVRGYDENEIAPSGGLALLLANAELRVPIAGPFGLEVYVDAGNVWDRPEYITKEDFTPRFGEVPVDPGNVRYAAGFGGRFNLPFGPLRADYTWRPASRPRFQFAIGSSF